ncbi:MAG TPA: hypothetical protein VL172_19440, partial [Kofleriaceae bacterium]|nr:hypothetical protein [Kofleriaceae bacterium]
IGVGFLGQPRSPAAEHAHESPPGMVLPMVVLAAAAIAVPLVGTLLLPAFRPVIGQLAPAAAGLPAAAEILRPIGALSAALWVALLANFALIAVLVRRRRADDTWGCGYAAPSARMQYTAGSFAQLGQGMLPAPLRPRLARSRLEAPFPATGSLTSRCDDPFTRAAYEPFLDRWAGRFARLRWLQQGSLHIYLLYILATRLVTLAAAAAATRWGWP